MISAGSPRSVSNRANASKGEVVSTPPKSQITASTIMSRPANIDFTKRLTRCAGLDQPRSSLGDEGVSGYFYSMKISALMAASLVLLVSVPADAIVGGGVPSAE